MKWKIHAIPTGELAGTMNILMLNSGVRPGPAPRPFGFDTEIPWYKGKKAPGVRQPVPVWLIEAAEKKILVDTGFDSAEDVLTTLDRYGINAYCVRRPEWELAAALEARGVRPEEIETVIITHMHFDHIGNLELFPNASIIVQRDELGWALAPPNYGMFYYREFSSHITEVRHQIRAIEGDYRIAPGVEVWKVAGHSPGLQAVAVETASGKAVIASDNVYDYVNWEDRWPIGVYWRLDQVLAAYARYEREADIVLPNHDWKLWEVFPDGVIG
jgi:glyoxylase-like metal-dependent hydrolase (beta-lactamase superfamily II)